MVKIVNSIPLIPLVWSTLIKYWKEFENANITEGDDILKLNFWGDKCPKTSQDVLLALHKIEKDISCSFPTM